MQSIELTLELEGTNQPEPEQSEKKLKTSKNHESDDDSGNFQLLQDDSDPEFDAEGKNGSNGQNKTLTVKLEDYYEVILEDQIEKQFQSEQQWQEFYDKICSGKIDIKVKDFISLIRIESNQLCSRKLLWERVVYSRRPASSSQIGIKEEPIEDDVVQKNLHHGQILDSKIKMQDLTDLDKKFLREIDKNVKRMIQKWKDINSEHLSNSIVDLVTDQILEDKQISNHKGMEYLCLGIILSSPVGSHVFHQRCLGYFLKDQEFCKLYYQGEPLFYKQLPLLIEEMKVEVPDLYQVVNCQNPEWGKLFTSYYKSLMTYKIKNMHVIAKLFDLLLAYGIKIVRIILIKILIVRQKYLLTQIPKDELVGYMGTSIIVDYFASKQQMITMQQVQNKMKLLITGNYNSEEPGKNSPESQ